MLKIKVKYLVKKYDILIVLRGVNLLYYFNKITLPYIINNLNIRILNLFIQ